ncbi:MAG: hypothetical protein ACLU4J_03295 [Butyricimonas paravirosa]
MGQCEGSSCNQLIIRMTPDEGVMLKFGLKMPGGGFTVKQVGMDFCMPRFVTIICRSLRAFVAGCHAGGSMLYTRMMPWKPVGSLSIRS